AARQRAGVHPPPQRAETSPTAKVAKSKPKSLQKAAMIRVVLDSTLPRGYLMVAVNDEIRVRRPFSFTKRVGLFKSARTEGTVQEELKVPPGSISLKAWLTTPDGSFSGYRILAANLQAGDNRTLLLSVSNDQLQARLK